MPPKKRTSQTGHTPPSPTTTTSTSHAPTDQQHHLRHTGPSISTRPRAGTAPSKPPPAPAQPDPSPESPTTQKSAHDKKQPADVRPLGPHMSLAKLTSILLITVLLLLAWYIYGMVTLLGLLKDQAGWWDIVVGDASVEAWRGWRFGAGREGGVQVRGDLEGSLNALADALGISPVQVASAVKPLIPKESLTSIIASRAEQTGSPGVVRILFEDTTQDEGEESGSAVQDEDAA